MKHSWRRSFWTSL